MNKNKFVTFFIITAFCMLMTWLLNDNIYMVLIFSLLFVSASAVINVYSDSIFSAIFSLILIVEIYLITNNLLITLSTLLFCALGSLLGLMFRKQAGKNTLVCTAVVGVMAVAVINMLILSYQLKENCLAHYIGILKPQITALYKTRLTELNMQNLAQEILSQLDIFFKSIVLLTPSIIVCSSAVIGFVTVFIVSVAGKFSEKIQNNAVNFFEYKADAVTVFIYLVSLIATMFMSEGVVSIALNNIYVILQFFLMVCGFSLIDFMLKKRKFPLILRTVIILILFTISVLPIISAVIVIAAVFDSNRDFRKLLSDVDKTNRNE